MLSRHHILSNPRASASILLAVTALTLVLLWSTLYGDLQSFQTLVAFRRPYVSTADRIDRSELLYEGTVKQRWHMIDKYGPKVTDIASFPDPETGYPYTLWDFFHSSFNCPHSVRRIGVPDDGGKWVCGVERLVEQHHSCVVYSFGVNNESSFEPELLSELPHCQLYGYDFNVSSFGPEIETNFSLASRSHFFPYALGNTTNTNEHPPTYTLTALMKANDHTFIDLLKIDIEGAEFESLAEMIQSSSSVLPFGQLQLEIHALNSEYAKFPKFLEWWESPEKAGLRPFWTETNLGHVNLDRSALPDVTEYSFINIKGRHALIMDDY
ncbi:hypothetical protein FIBSPDRAFT_813653 [Athelia psychrophila]|uniref:Methyltransferase domain-containing protein n=1 Tax=Athelia psychrophila TaxID=1759441 RepID=A0A166U8X1_9AGAM|nr:hypothetical protein FIBSPDRAFT_813653 [Fibularhizoctonia sp. CBS 109695]